MGGYGIVGGNLPDRRRASAPGPATTRASRGRHALSRSATRLPPGHLPGQTLNLGRPPVEACCRLHGDHNQCSAWHGPAARPLPPSRTCSAKGGEASACPEPLRMAWTSSPHAVTVLGRRPARCARSGRPAARRGPVNLPLPRPFDGRSGSSTAPKEVGRQWRAPETLNSGVRRSCSCERLDSTRSSAPNRTQRSTGWNSARAFLAEISPVPPPESLYDDYTCSDEQLRGTTSG